MEQKLDITKLSKADKILFLELMKGFVGKDEYGYYWGLCGSAGFAGNLLFLSPWFWPESETTNAQIAEYILGVKINESTTDEDGYLFPRTNEGTAKRLALIDKAIAKLKSK